MISCFQDEAKKRHTYFLNRMTRKNSISKKSHRIILIGTGESGKSTFVKQMKLLSSRNQQYDDDYKVSFKAEIHRNLVQGLSALIENMPLLVPPESFDDHNSAKMNKLASKIIKIKAEIDRSPDAIEEIAGGKDSAQFYDMCKALWKDNGIQRTFRRSNEFQIIDSAQYFLDRIDAMRDYYYYIPSEVDVLQCRTKTLGIHTEQIAYNNVTFEFVDVGGQRDQRSKWIEAMSDGVTAVIFLSDVSAYDMTLEEDGVTKRLSESVQLLKEVWRKNPLRDKSVILFLNKQDKLEKKVRAGVTDIEQYFPEFKIEKKRFLYNFLRDLAEAKTKKGKKEAEVWDRYFTYFIPDQKKSGKDEAERNTHDSQLISEYHQVQNKIKIAFSDEHVDNWLKSKPNAKSEEEIFNYLLGEKEFNMFMNKMLQVNFFKVVCITHFIQNMFLAGCEQSTNRHIYPYPTTAIDKRNMDRVFESCKDIMQGKILTEIMA